MSSSQGANTYVIDAQPNDPGDETAIRLLIEHMIKALNRKHVATSEVENEPR